MAITRRDKDFFGNDEDSFTTEYENGSRSRTSEDFLGNGYTTRYDDGTFSHTTRQTHLFGEDTYETVYSDGHRERTFRTGSGEYETHGDDGKVTYHRHHTGFGDDYWESQTYGDDSDFVCYPTSPGERIWHEIRRRQTEVPFKCTGSGLLFAYFAHCVLLTFCIFAVAVNPETIYSFRKLLTDIPGLLLFVAAWSLLSMVLFVYFWGEDYLLFFREIFFFKEHNDVMLLEKVWDSQTDQPIIGKKTQSAAELSRLLEINRQKRKYYIGRIIVYIIIAVSLSFLLGSIRYLYLLYLPAEDFLLNIVLKAKLRPKFDEANQQKN